MKNWLKNGIANGEEGHVATALPSLLAAAGVITLGYAGANGSDTWMVIGGFAAGLGIVAGAVWRHMTIDYDFYRRFNGKK